MNENDGPDELTLCFIRNFPVLYKKIGGVSASQHLMAAFTSCYSFLSSSERMQVLISVNQMAKEIGATKFEDPIDFLSFVQEKIEEY